MRLIEEEALLINIVKAAPDLRRLSTKTIGEAIDRTPTVAAIPIEWVKRYASKKSADDEMDCYWHFWEEDVLKMIDDWEKGKA